MVPSGQKQCIQMSVVLYVKLNRLFHQFSKLKLTSYPKGKTFTFGEKVNLVVWKMIKF